LFGFEVLMAVSKKMAVFWAMMMALMMEAARTSETLVNYTALQPRRQPSS
jgi:hypothetical protein